MACGKQAPGFLKAAAVDPALMASQFSLLCAKTTKNRKKIVLHRVGSAGGGRAHGGESRDGSGADVVARVIVVASSPLRCCLFQANMWAWGGEDT